MKKNLLTIFSVLFISLFFVFAANAQTDNNSNKGEKKTEKQENDQSLKIKRKPIKFFILLYILNYTLLQRTNAFIILIWENYPI